VSLRGCSQPVEADNGVSHQCEGEQPHGVPIPAHLQPSPATQPRQGALDLPAAAASRCEDSTPRRAIRGRLPRRRSARRLARLWYALSAWSLAGRLRRWPEGVRTAGTSSTMAASSAPSGVLAAVTATAKGRPVASVSRCGLDPGLPRSTGLGPTWSPTTGPHGHGVHAGSGQSTTATTPSRSSIWSRRRSNTPTAGHWSSRRRTVLEDPQPSSAAGNSRHGVEVRAMNTTAAKQPGQGMVRVPPPHQGRGAGGRSGATIAHNPSGTSVSARVVTARKHAIPPRGATRRLSPRSPCGRPVPG
jgi:hypothetical protein